ncbi:MAG TPA: CoA transferase, partial [Candidatus Limnocylindrales bacterium]
MSPESEPAANPGPLAGLRVVDCSTVLAGPYCTMVLGDLGADVIKVEPPGGDATRGWGPPWVGDEADGTRTAAYFLAVNRNKRSIRVDLRRSEGADVLRRLLAGADVLVENFRAGSLDGLGFGDDALRAINPRLVHLAITGYGAASPDPARPGYDFVIQAESGLMSITGSSDEDGGG